MGALQLCGGLLEVGSGALLMFNLTAPVVSQLGGIALVGHGLDTVGAGYRTLRDGAPSETYFFGTIKEGLQAGGVNESVAKWTATGADVALPLVAANPVGFGRALIRGGVAAASGVAALAKAVATGAIKLATKGLGALRGAMLGLGEAANQGLQALRRAMVTFWTVVKNRLVTGVSKVTQQRANSFVDFNIVNRVQGSTQIDQALRFTDAEIAAEMSRSPIGQSVVDAANNNTITLDFRSFHPQPGVLGFRLPNSNTGVIFVENAAQYSAPGVVDQAASLRAVGDTAVHEGLHALGLGGSWDAELWVRRLTFEHTHGFRPTATDIAQMEADMLAAGPYKSLPKNLNKTIQIGGLTISY
jgi:hypothetical protein